MAKKRANKGVKTLTGKRTKTLTEQQRLRRAELKVQRIEAQLYGKVPRDGVISDHLEKVGRGERGEFIKQSLYERIAREIAGHEMDTGINNVQYEDIVMRLDDLKNRDYSAGENDAPAAIDILRAELDELRHDLATQAQQFNHQLDTLRREIDHLRAQGGVEIDDEPVTVLSEDDPRQQALSAKLKGISFGSLNH